MVMKTINVAELKTHLSKYLRLVRKGEHIVVRDRNELVAEIIPLPPTEDLWQRLAREKGVRLGKPRTTPFVASKTKKKVDWMAHLRWVRGET